MCLPYSGSPNDTFELPRFWLLVFVVCCCLAVLWVVFFVCLFLIKQTLNCWHTEKQQMLGVKRSESLCRWLLPPVLLSVVLLTTAETKYLAVLCSSDSAKWLFSPQYESNGTLYWQHFEVHSLTWCALFSALGRAVLLSGVLACQHLIRRVCPGARGW